MNSSAIIILGIISVLVISGCASTVPQGDQPDGAGTEKTYEPAQTPRQAFDAYRKAIDEGDFEGFKRYVPSKIMQEMNEQIPGGMSEENFEQIFALLSAFMVPAADILVVDEATSEDSVNWTVSDMSDPKATGTIMFVREDGSWKMLKEEWKSA
jgi:hypothetical protein